jgi:hypothetical protein
MGTVFMEAQGKTQEQALSEFNQKTALARAAFLVSDSNKEKPEERKESDDAKITDPREQLRIWLDRTFVATSFTLFGIIVAWLILNIRAFASLDCMRNSRIGAVRYTAKSIFEMMPDARKMRPFTFTPLLGIAFAGIVNGLIFTVFLVGIVLLAVIASPIGTAFSIFTT